MVSINPPKEADRKESSECKQGLERSKHGFELAKEGL